MAYDELGQLKTKKLAPGYNNNAGIETLVYDYNIRGWMLGMNRDYLLAEGQSGSTKFGFELGYDKPVNKTGQNFSNTVQYNGNIAGMTWKSDGDDVRRMYSFGYDGANRLLKGDFVQQNPDDHSWNNNRINYSMQMGNGTDNRTAYDANGNILSMTQYGWKLGAGASTPIDKLTYNYTDGSNRLKAVLDEVNDPMTKLGDFRTSGTHPFAAYKTPANTWVTDYNYDANGNLTTDYNKDISVIAYNYLNLPAVINSNKGTIIYTYDAAGNKLEKKVTEGTTLTITTYLGGAVYQSKGVTGAPGADALQFIGHEEGRMRVDAGNTATPNPYDYMLKDHLGNVRMVLTDEQQTNAYPVASLETATLSTEKLIYTIPDAVNVRVNKSSVSGYPNDTYTSPNDFIHKLNGNGTKVGTSIVLKVMAGDKFNIRANSWYKLNGATPQAPVNPLNDLLAALITGVAGTGKATVSELTNSTVLTPGMTSFLNGQTAAQGKPKAFLNWVLFDEQLKFVSTGSGFDQVGEDNSATVKTHQFDNLPVNKNGFLYIYVSNETPNIDVFFDNLQITHTRGQILEETHYYPFGLTMAGISSKAAGGLENKKKYNGIDWENDLELAVYDAFYRELDPQIGRFIEIDPKTEDMYLWSPYVSNFDNPITYSDPLGDEAEEGDGCCGGIIDKVVEVTKEVGKGLVLFTAGSLNAWGSNQILGGGRVDVNEQSGLSYNSKLIVKGGQVVGDVASIVTGALEITGSGTGEVASLGIASPLAIPVAVHGSTSIGMGITNLIKGALNPVKKDESTSSSGSNAGKRRENRLPDQGQPNSTQTNKPGTTTKKYGPNGNVQKEHNKGHTGKGTPKNERNDHIHDYKPNPQNPTGTGTRMPGRPPKRNELKKDF